MVAEEIERGGEGTGERETERREDLVRVVLIPLRSSARGAGRAGTTSSPSSVATAGEERDDREHFPPSPLDLLLTNANKSFSFYFSVFIYLLR